MSCNPLAVAIIQTIKSDCSQSNSHRIISVELNLHADTYVVGSNFLLVHDNECFIDTCGIDEAARHKNTCTIDAAIMNNLEGHDNPILDTCLCDIEFDSGEVTTLTANAIVHAMYAQRNTDGNEYLLLED